MYIASFLQVYVSLCVSNPIKECIDHTAQIFMQSTWKPAIIRLYDKQRYARENDKLGKNIQFYFYFRVVRFIARVNRW